MSPGRILRWDTPMKTGPIPPLECPVGTNPVLPPCGATWDRAETVCLDFLIIAAMYGVLGFSGDIQSLELEAISRTRWHVDFYKKWRRKTLTSSCHLLTPIRPINDRTGCTVLQLQSADAATNLIFHFYRSNDGQERRRVQLCNLEPETMYNVQRTGPSGETETKLKGAELMKTGLELAEPYSQHALFKAAIIVIEPVAL